MRYLEVENKKIGDTAWITRGLPSGIYMLRIRIADRTLQRFITAK
jgi:pectate lyase